MAELARWPEPCFCFHLANLRLPAQAGLAQLASFQVLQLHGTMINLINQLEIPGKEDLCTKPC